MLSGISFKQTKCGGKLDADAASDSGVGVKRFSTLITGDTISDPFAIQFLFEKYTCANPLDSRLDQQSVSVQNC